MGHPPLDLFGPRVERAPAPLRAWRGIRRWWEANRGRFSVVFAEALSFHAVLFFILVLTQIPSLARRPDGDSNLDTIRGTIRELAKNPENPGFADALKEGGEALAKSLDRAVHFDDGLDKKVRAQILESMIRAFFRMKQTQGGTYVDVSALSLSEIQALIEQSPVLRLKTGEKAFSSRGADPLQGFQLTKIDRSREYQIQRYRRVQSEEREEARVFGDQVRVETRYASKSGASSMPAEVYYRECPYEQILAAGSRLFTAVRGFYAFGSPPAGGGGPAGKKPEIPPPGANREFLTIYFVRPVWTGSGSGESRHGAEGAFSEVRTAEILDGLMAYPEVKQVALFDRDYLKTLDPDGEDLARLARRFIAANLNTVFYMADDFSMAFDFVEELYYKRPVYEAFAAYWREHPRTKAASEFLFSLADAYDFERRALLLLDRVREGAVDILANRARRTNAFDYKVKAYVLKELGDEVRSALKRGGFVTAEMAAHRYREEEAAIYALLDEMGGPTRDRASFALGQAYWEDGAVEPALAAWRRIDPANSAPTFKLIQPYLGRTGEALSEAVSKIGQILSDGAVAGSGDILRRQIKFRKWEMRSAALR